MRKKEVSLSLPDFRMDQLAVMAAQRHITVEDLVQDIIDNAITDFREAQRHRMPDHHYTARHAEEVEP